jgi:hypothetical protein
MIRCTSARLSVPVRLLWHVRHVPPIAAERRLLEELLAVELLAIELDVGLCLS